MRAIGDEDFIVEELTVLLGLCEFDYLHTFAFSRLSPPLYSVLVRDVSKLLSEFLRMRR
jgi:hypothetical protein